jgi:hypothetical protein
MMRTESHSVGSLSYLCFAGVLLLGSACSEAQLPEAEPLENLYASLVVQSLGEETEAYGHFETSVDSPESTWLPISEIRAEASDGERLLPIDVEDSYFHQTFWNFNQGTLRLRMTSRHNGVQVTASATLPEPFQLVVPNELPRDQSLEIDLGPASAGTKLEYYLGGDCIEPLSAERDDTEQLRFEANDFVPLPGKEEAACSVLLKVFRSAQGKVDPAFGHGGVFRAQQLRTVEFVSLPRVHAE